jgi:glycosyltransferase involved in cell wall biosynthesis
MKNPQPPYAILFTHFGVQWLRGSELVLLDLLTKLNRDNFRVIIWTNVLPLAEKTMALGLPTHVSSFETYFDWGSNSFSPRRYIKSVREAVRLIRYYGIALLHANSAAPTQWLAPAAWITQRPLVVHLHAPYLARNRFFYGLHQADHLVGVSNYVLGELRTDGLAESRLSVIYNGIDETRFAPNKDGDFRTFVDVPEHAILLGAVGSLIHRKGFDLLIQALALLSSNYYLCLIGDGEDAERLKKITGDLGVTGRVRFLGHCPDPSPLFHAADMLVMPSRQEAFGLVLLEAGICGLPAVASRVGGIPEVIIDQDTGLLVPPEDAHALANAITLLGSSASFRQRLGENARARIQSQFSLAQMVTQFEKLYLAQIMRQKRDKISLSERLLPYQRRFFGQRG